MAFLSASQQVCALLQKAAEAGDKQAEAQLNEFESQPGYGAILASIFGQSDGNQSVRQLAGILLRTFVEKHWDPSTEKFEQPLASIEERESIRATVESATLVGDPNSKIQTTVAMVIAKIAQYDFPERWPNLLKGFVQYLTNGSPTLRLGALRCIKHFADEIDPPNLSDVLPTLFPVLLKIFDDSQNFSPDERALSAVIYREFITTLSVLDMEDGNSRSKQLIRPTLLSWLESLSRTLADLSFSAEEVTTADCEATQCSVRAEAAATLAQIAGGYSKALKKHASSVLPTVWQCLSFCVPMYHKRALDEGAQTGAGDLEMLMLSLLDLLEGFGSDPSLKKSLRPILADLVYVFIDLMQMPNEQCETLMDDVDGYVIALEADVDMPLQSWGLRESSVNLLCRFMDNFGGEVMPLIISAAQTHLVESEQLKERGSSVWWKKREAAVYILGHVINEICESPDEEKAKVVFDSNSLAKNIVLPDSGEQNQHIFLRGRALWCGHHLVEAVEPALKTEILRAAVGSMQESCHMVVRLSAIHAVNMICANLPAEVVSQFIPNAITLGAQMLSVSHSESKHLVLNAFNEILSVDPTITAQAEPTVTPMMISVWESNLSDRTVTECVKEVFASMAETKLCLAGMQQRALPPLMNIFGNAQKHLSGTVASALEILQCLLDVNEPPLPDIYINQVLPIVVKLILETDDHSLLSEGAECLTVMVRLAGPKIASTQVDGTPAIGLICQVVAKLLSPDFSDSAAESVGKLVSQIVNKLGGMMGDTAVSELLSAVIRRLYIAENLSLEQDLVLVFARLAHQHDKHILDFLEKIGEIEIASRKTQQVARVNMLQFVLQKWANLHKDIAGLFHMKLSLCALSRLLASMDPRLLPVVCQGYPVVEDKPRRMCLRSSGNDGLMRYSELSLPVKILALLVQTWQAEMDDEEEEEKGLSDADSDLGDGDNFWGDHSSNTASQNSTESPFSPAIGKSLSKKDYIKLSELLDRPFLDDMDGVLLDPEEKKDPLNDINLKNFIVDFCKSFSQSNSAAFNELASGLSEVDQHALRTLLG
eukprot:45673_1